MTTSAIAAPEPVDSLDAALLRAQKRIRAIGKDGTNDYHKYKYATAEAIIGAGREVLHEEGVLLRRVGAVLLHEGTILRSTFRLAYPATREREEETFDFPVVPEKGRPNDKATAGSLTTIEGYYIRDVLLLPRDDDQMDKRDDRAFVVSDQPTPKRKSEGSLIPALGASIARAGGAASKDTSPILPDVPSTVVVEGPESAPSFSEPVLANQKDLAGIHAARTEGGHGLEEVKQWVLTKLRDFLVSQHLDVPDQWNITSSKQFHAAWVPAIRERLRDKTALL